MLVDSDTRVIENVSVTVLSRPLTVYWQCGFSSERDAAAKVSRTLSGGYRSVSPRRGAGVPLYVTRVKSFKPLNLQAIRCHTRWRRGLAMPYAVNVPRRLRFRPEIDVPSHRR